MGINQEENNIDCATVDNHITHRNVENNIDCDDLKICSFNEEMTMRNLLDDKKND